jgi:predicted RNA-binding Zn-ribbon protein involved in translation (DUF1610 family)
MSEEDFKCKNCGGDLSFSPGTQALKCPYCGTENENPDSAPEVHEELDFENARAAFNSGENTVEVQVEKCTACGADVTLEPNITTAKCDFCGTGMVISGKSHKAMKPQYLLPFSITKDMGKKSFREWITKRTFAPDALKRQARLSEPVHGIYYPHWTFDTQTDSSYTGERGTHYTESVTRRNSDGEDVTESVTRTRWSNASGSVKRFFDDVLVAASTTLKKKLTSKLNKWEFSKMISYDDKYLKGFKAESYSIDLEEGFEEAKVEINSEIRSDIRRDIGGDEQRIHKVNTAFNAITFKYILLPIWVVVYKFKNKYYQVLINADTGEIAGERPFSAAKIIGLILAILAVGGIGYLIYYLVSNGII